MILSQTLRLVNEKSIKLIECWRRHSLSIVLVGIWLALTAASAIPEPDSWVAVTLANLAGDAFGALLVVVATKYFIERGSAASK